MADTHQAPGRKVLINRKTLLGIIPLSDRAIFDMEKRGEFPRRIVLTSRNVAWDLEEVENWIRSRRQSGARALRPGPTVASR
ncbi:helix-turn-helix transcriptional regulator [Halioxenophilus sp. WMMB6]|uniref:helix-turn-helix transcriptional regulator n=1 Tax=Halioxenophilus sp. WMMB6 TaxID=3073815 RepID=UPI00295E899D|nr:AlpA family phage regulatory protein [Halioxenophilus sp. WMMB6]